MQLTISGHHIDITDPIRNYVTNKLTKITRHHDKVTNTHVILSVDKNNQKAEATMHISGADLFANCESQDLYAAIDQLSEKLDRQLIKHKEKRRQH